MKEKQIKYLLIAVVLGIWGYTFYKYFLYDPEPSGAANATALNTSLPINSSFTVERDSFALLEEYRDPFLGRPVGRRNYTESAPQAVSIPAPPSRTTAPKSEPAPINWSIFRYNGMVKQTGSDEMVGMLGIRGKLYSVQSGDLLAGTKVVWVEEDSIRIRFKEEEKTLLK